MSFEQPLCAHAHPPIACARSVAPSRQDVLSNLAFFFGDPAVPESKLRAVSNQPPSPPKLLNPLLICVLPSRVQNCETIPSTMRCAPLAIEP